MSAKVREYAGKDVVVRYDVKRCIHAAECVNGLPKVFDPDRRPWVDPDAAAADPIVEVIMRCPTGALHFQRKDGGAAEPVPDLNLITVSVDGPLYARGMLQVVNNDGTLKLEDSRVALCRCGASENKPFCDGRHSEAGFKAGASWAEAKPKPKEFVPGGELRVTPRPNGPLLVKGRVEIHSTDGGQTSFHDGQTALCRCGASRKKPFCDGSHKQIGFAAG